MTDPFLSALDAHSRALQEIAVLKARNAAAGERKEDDGLIMLLLRGRRWHIEAILDGTREAPKRKGGKGRKRRSGFRRVQFAYVNAEIARRLPHSTTLGEADGG